MNARWLVHCGDEALGPWSAEQVREELRAGRIDPFDLVASEGSAKKRPLIDVDEIFLSVRCKNSIAKNQSEQQEKTGLVVTAAAGSSSLSNPADSFEKTPQSQQFLETGGKKAPSFTKPRAFEALAAPLAVQKPAGYKQLQRPGLAAPKAPAQGVGAGTVRRYVLWTSEQSSQGPFTSREVLTFWYAKKLPAGTIVQRAGQSKRVSIQDFARFYEKAAPSGIAFVGEAQAAAGRLDASTRGLIIAVVAGVLIVAGAYIWSYASEGFFEYGHQLYKSVSGTFTSKLEVKQGGAQLAPAAPSRPDGLLKEQLPPPGYSPPSIMKRPRSDMPAQNGKKLNPTVERSPRSARTPTPRSPAPRSPAPRSPAPRSPAPASTVPAQTTTLKPMPNVELMDGSVVTLEGYEFNISALNSCQLKCKISMTGPKGPVLAVFFKEAFAPALSRKTSGITLTGTIRRDPSTGALSILVQSVK